MKKMIFILATCLALSGCCTFCKDCTNKSVAVSPPIYQGVPVELTNKPEPLPYLNVDTASQDDVAVWIAELWKRYTKLNEQRATVRELDDKFKVLYNQYLEQLQKGK